MTKVIIFKNQNGSVDITSDAFNNSIGMSTIELLMSSTGHPVFDSQDKVEREIRNLVDKDGLQEEDVRPYYEGLLNGNLTEKEAWDCLAGRSKRSHHVSYRVTDISNIPNDRTFRDAWHDENPTETVDINLSRAWEIKKDQLRQMRAPFLQALDIEYLKAQEEGNIELCTSIAEQKQALRDVTKVDLPNTSKELKTFIPSILS